MRRQTLDDLGPQPGTRLRVFFPHGKGARDLVATGEVRVSSSDRYEHDHLMKEGSSSEWVPGWYVAQPVAVRRVYV